MHQRAQATTMWVLHHCNLCATRCSNKNVFQLHAPSGVTSIRIVDRFVKLLSCCMIRSCCCKHILNKIISLFLNRLERGRSCISVHKPQTMWVFDSSMQFVCNNVLKQESVSFARTK